MILKIFVFSKLYFLKNPMTIHIEFYKDFHWIFRQFSKNLKNENFQNHFLARKKNYFSFRFFCTIWNSSLDSIYSILSTPDSVQRSVASKIQKSCLFLPWMDSGYSHLMKSSDLLSSLWLDNNFSVENQST